MLKKKFNEHSDIRLKSCDGCKQCSCTNDELKNRLDEIQRTIRDIGFVIYCVAITIALEVIGRFISGII